MGYKISHWYSIIASLQQNFCARFIDDEHQLRKASLLCGIILIGILFLLLLGILAFIQGGLLLGTLDFSAACLLIALFVFLQRKGDIEFCTKAGIFIMFCLYLYLFISGGIDGNAFLWSYTFPLFTFFLLGSRDGILISLTYLSFCFAVLLLDLNSVFINLYDKNFALRFVPSLGVVILFSFIYERFREGYEKAMINSQNSLEKKVKERTEDLRQKIIEKEKAQVAAIRAKQEWERTFDAVPDSIIILDNNYRILRTNKAMVQLLKTQVNELVSQKCYKIMHGTDEPPPFCPYSKLLKDHQPHSIEYFAEHLGRHFLSTVSPLHDDQGIVLGAVNVLRDITAHKKAEQEKKIVKEKLRKSEKMEAIGLMAGGVAHDLNNILSGIVSYPELMLLGLPPSSELRGPLETIHESGKRAASVVADLLTVARGVASKKGSHDANVLLREYLDSPEYKELTSLYPGVVCVEKLDAEYPIIVCSPMHIKKTIMNLITNAAEAVGNDGRILVSTCNQQGNEIEKSKVDLDHGNYLVLTVEDNGPGIADKDLDHIFEPFYTKKIMGQSGTGLGLAIVWNAVQDLNGRIFVESSAEGTSFQLFIPVSEEESVGQDDNSKAENLNGNNERILVVDDEPQLIDIASQILRVCGYRVDSVCSGELAIEFVKNNPVDLMVLDMVMGPGLNGLQTYREVVTLYPKQKAIIASGYSQNNDVEAAFKLGAGGFIKKPYTMNELSQVVKETLNG
ncbi:MAG: response regulator [Desulfobulbaceae bacterium]|nr:response regulator [Desulfobulbaceae bacterium]